MILFMYRKFYFIDNTLSNNANFFSFHECSNFTFYTKRSGRLEFSYKAGSLFYRSNENKWRVSQADREC